MYARETAVKMLPGLTNTSAQFYSIDFEAKLKLQITDVQSTYKTSAIVCL
jgi:hypothetical protein